MNITTYPPVLMFVIKRFSYSWRSSKVDSFVMLPMSLDFCGIEYTLASFITHSGTLGRGHYKAYVDTGSGWRCFNDGSVKSVPFTEVQQKKAYVVFYKILGPELQGAE